MSHPTGRATVEVIALTTLFFLVQTGLLLVGVSMELFALAAPLLHRPWTIVTSVYSHGGPGHLFANLIGLLVFGLIVERRASRWRFHAFIVGTGALAGIAEVLVGSLLGSSPLVVGISGAVFALMGYIIAANPVTESLIGRIDISPRAQFVIMLLLALAITWITRGERVAMVAHFTGFLLGVVSGRLRLLDDSR